MYSKITFCLRLACIVSLIQYPQHPSDQIYGFLLAKMHCRIFRIQGVQAVLLVFFYISFVPNDKSADLAILEVGPMIYFLDSTSCPLRNSGSMLFPLTVKMQSARRASGEA